MRHVYILLACILISLQAYGQRLLSQERNKALRDSLVYSLKKIDLEVEIVENSTSRSSIFLSPKFNRTAQNVSSKINYNRPTVKIPYSINTSPSGAFLTTIPIETIPNAKFAPQISIQYNSLANDGILGNGWSIAGISSIRWSPTNLFYDDDVKPFRFEYEWKAFSLDGIRLLEAGRNKRSANLVTEQGKIFVSSNTSISTSSLNGYPCVWFKAYYPNGQVAEYSNINKGKQIHSPFINAPVCQITDKLGYKIYFEYQTFPREEMQASCIKRILYGAKGAASSPYSLEFEYIEHDNPQALRYIGGIKYHANKLLKRIHSKKGNEVFRTYEFSYKFINKESFLEQVDCTSPEEKLNPLVFNYSIEDKSLDAPRLRKQNAESQILLSKFNLPLDSLIHLRGHFYKKDLPSSSGLSDRYKEGLIIYPKLNPYTFLVNKHKNPTGLLGSNYHPEQEIIVVPYLGGGLIAPKTILAGRGFQSLQAVDTDGDGLDELIKINLSGISSDGRKTIVKISKYDKNFSEKSKIEASFEIEGVAHIISNSPHFQKAYFGNFLGDGRTTLLLLTPNTTMGNDKVGSKQTLIDLESLSIIDQQELFTCEFETLKDLHAIDINGDGKTDLCYFKDNQIDIYNYSFKKLKLISSIIDFEQAQDSNPYFTDINSDGHMDILYAPKSSDDTWTIYLNKQGYNLDFHFEKTTQEICRVSKKKDVLFMDVNKDRFTDLLVNSSGELSVYLNEKGTFQQTAIARSKTDRNSSLTPLPIVPLGLGYNGISSSLLVINKDRFDNYIFTEDKSKDKLLNRIYDSFGLSTEIGYSDVFSSYLLNETTEANYLTEKFPMNLVSNIVQFDNKGQTIKDVSYYYFNPTLHRLGLGFCGFKKIETYDRLNEQKSIQEYNPYLRGILIKEEVYNQEEDQMLSKTEYIYKKNLVSNNLAKGRIPTWNQILSNILAYDKLNNINSKTSFEYNPFGEPITILKEYDDGNKEETTILSYLFDEKDKYLQEEKYISTTRVCPYSGGVYRWTKVKEFFYNDSYTLLTGIKEYVGKDGDQLIREEILEYDNQDRVILKKTIPYNRAVSLTTHYKYEGDYLTALIDEKGLKTEYKEHDIYGNPFRVIDPRGNITDILYDSWGRLMTQSYNNNYTAHREFWQDGKIVKELYTGVLNEGMHLKSRQESDILGRELLSGAIQFDGSMLWTEKRYNKKGLLSSVSLPYKDGTCTHRAGYKYDKYNRLTSVTYPSGRKEEYAYAPLEKTSIIDGIKSKKCFNAIGQLVSSEDLGGKISYSYRPDGQLSSIIAPNGAKTLFEYDDCGRQVKLIDPSAGEQITRYTYHDNGYSSIEQQNANGTTKAEYNPFGELKFQDFGADQQVEYRHNKYGDLVQVFSRNGLNKYYRYDSFGRVIEQVHKLSNLTYKELYTYHRNRLVETRYELPNGETLKETYSYQNEQHTETHLYFNSDSTRVYQLKEINGQGTPSKVQTGALSRTYEYSHFGLLTKRTISKADELLQEQTYSFNPLNYNLLGRTYYLGAKKISENFQYDKLNRLITQVGDIPLSKNVRSYNSNGCITSNGSANFQYFNSAKPYQLSSIEAYSSLEIKDLIENTDSQELTYTAFNRPKTIAQGDRIATFSYDEEATRVQMAITNKAGELLDNRYYFRGRYETDKEREIFYVDGNAYTAPAVLIKEEGDWKLYYIGRDYQGSITELIDEEGNLIEQYAYAPWGRRASLSHSIESISEAAKSKLRHGYTGHEYLPEFGLINMNARLYDPYLGLFLSPDPYVQNPEFSQNLNRYTYCLNNPLKYTDKSGKFFTGTIITFVVDFLKTAFIDGGLDPTSKSARERAWRKFDPTAKWSATNKAWRIDMGSFKTDSDKTVLDRVIQFVSRWTWELPQTLAGKVASHSRNLLGEVDRVDYFGGATFVINENSLHNQGFSLGNYINIDISDQLKGNFEQELLSIPMFMHEYGHYIDSQKWGPLYLFAIGIPSLRSAAKSGNVAGYKHYRFWTERRANRNAAKYFSKYGIDWSIYENNNNKSYNYPL